jgi:hypothetical protein
MSSKTVRCPLCPKEKRRDNLTVHFATHFHPYVCNGCGIFSTKMDTMKRHLLRCSKNATSFTTTNNTRMCLSCKRAPTLVDFQNHPCCIEVFPSRKRKVVAPIVTIGEPAAKRSVPADPIATDSSSINTVTSEGDSGVLTNTDTMKGDHGNPTSKMVNNNKECPICRNVVKFFKQHLKVHY